MKQIKITVLTLSLLVTQSSVCMDARVAAGVLGLRAAANLMAAAVYTHRTAGTQQLVLAAQEGDFATIESLLPSPYVNAQIGAQQNTALIMACQAGHEEIVSLLLQAKALPEIVNIEGCSPLLLASQNGYTGIVHLLLTNGGQSTINTQNKDKCSPLRQASYNGKQDVVRILLAAKADTQALDDRNFSALTLACEKGHVETVDMLLQNGARNLINAKTKEGATPLRQASYGGHESTVELLLRNGAQESVNERDNIGATPLIAASQMGHERVVRILVEAKAQPEIANFSGVLPIHIASQEGHAEVAKFLLERAPGLVNAPGPRKLTPLHLASNHDRENIVLLLLLYKANPLLKDASGFTPLECTRNAWMQQLFKNYSSLFSQATGEQNPTQEDLAELEEQKE